MSAESLRQFKNFSQNLKKTSLGIRFGKKLFTNPYSMSPREIAAVLRSLGMNIPREAVVAADLAQVITTGQALYASYQAGKSAGELTNPSVATVNAGIQLLSDSGMIEDKDSNIARTVQLGSDIACLIGSCGTDWRAWTSLAISAYVENLKNKIGATQTAVKNLSEVVSGYLSKEQVAWGNNFKDLQDGKIGILGWVTKNAMLAPSTFYQNVKNNPNLIQQFPFLAGIDALPLETVTFTAEASQSDTFMGQGNFNTAHDRESYSLTKIASLGSEDQAREYIFRALIEPSLKMYAYAESYFRNQNKISTENLFVLFALGSPLQYVLPGFDVSQEFRNQLVSPFELNETFLQEFLSRELPPAQKFHETLISGEITTYKKDPVNYFIKYRQLIASADRAGDVEKLFYFQETKEVMSKYSTFELIPDNYGMVLDRGGKKFQVREKYMAWRKMQNFATAMQYIELIKKDPFFFKWESESLKKYSFIHDLDFVEGKISYLSKLSMIRKVNRLAVGNVRYFVGNAKKLNPGAEGPAIYEV